MPSVHIEVDDREAVTQNRGEVGSTSSSLTTVPPSHLGAEGELIYDNPPSTLTK